jgi:regulator of sirC expression with transglutaminase-like and TPR domain
MTPREAFERWRSLSSSPEDAWHPEEAALLYAVPEYPGLFIEDYLRRLDALAEEIRPILRPFDSRSSEAARRLCRHLYEIVGFLGNREAYDDPRNSYLNEVIDRKLGIPITLSLVGMAVARRLDAPLEGVGMPGHFLLRSPDGPVYFDPFSGGHPVAEEECKERLFSLYGDSLPWSPRYLEPVSDRTLLLRMLNNLKVGYLRRGDYARLKRIARFSYELSPSPQDAELLERLRDWDAGI